MSVSGWLSNGPLGRRSNTVAGPELGGGPAAGWKMLDSVSKGSLMHIEVFR